MKRNITTVKKVLISAVIILAIILVGVVVFIGYLSQGLKEMAAWEVPPVDASHLEDGAYTGYFIQGRWSNELVVHVQNKSIVSIDVIKTVKFEREEVTDALIGNVLAAQSTDVDAVSSATITSQAYLQSIANALSTNQP